MKVILSIKPQFAKRIFEGSKKFEFRRSIFKNPDVNEVIVYASAPISKIIGEFKVDGVINSEVDDLWTKTKKYSGISEEYFKEYFEGKDKGYAIKIDKPKRYKHDKCIIETFGIRAPQSFAYIKH